MAWQIYGAAVARDRRVLIAGHFGFPRAAERTAGMDPGAGVYLAAADMPELAAWLVEAINAEIEGVILDQPRPTGHIVARGRFTTAPDEPRHVYADRGGMGVLVVVADSDGVARGLVGRLNAILEK